MTALQRLDPRPAFALLVAGGVSLVIGRELIQKPSLVRMLLLALVIAILFVLSTTEVETAIVVTFALLPFLGLSRRLLISTTGWPGRDPLVLLGAGMVAILFVRLFVLERRPLTGDRLSQLVLGLVVLTALGSLNLQGAGVSAGAAGFLYVGVPMLWYFVGRELLSAEGAQRLLYVVAGVGCLVALYGLYQLTYGFPSWDRSWIAITSYNSLSVGGRVRSFSTFPSSAEYATYLGIGVIAGFAAWLNGRRALVLLAPLLGVALFLDGSRGPLVLVLVALFAVFGLDLGSTRKLVVALVLGLVLGALVLHQYAGSLTTSAASSNNPLVTHQVTGLTHPLNSQSSTFLVHWHNFESGIKRGFTDPIGSGTASISLGGSQLGAASKSTEFDVSNAFVGLGFLGGLVFVLILVHVARQGVSLYFVTRERVALMACGALVVTAGQWLNGGFYTVAPLTWLLVGWIAGENRRWLRAGATDA